MSGVQGVTQVFHWLGLLVPYGDEVAIYKAMKEILLNKEKAQELGREGKKTVLREFDINHISKQYMALMN